MIRNVGFAVICTVLAVVTVAAANDTIELGPIEDVQFGPLINAPNGQISFQKHPRGYKIWLSGSLQSSDQKGGFLFQVRDWTRTELAEAQPTFVLGAEAPDDTCPNNDDFDRNRAAIDAVVPGAKPGTLLGFYDAEYHAKCPGTEPLFSSIGLAISSDGGVTWVKQGQIIQGLDEANNGFDYVVDKQLEEVTEGNNKYEVGTSGPSAVVRKDGARLYVYLYYADRTPIAGTPTSIYVARAPLASDGMPGNWQKWTSAGWGVMGDQKSAAPIVTRPAGTGTALQPQVSFNRAFCRWLMVFKTVVDFRTATSKDGLNWDPSISLLTFLSTDSDTGFPSLISPYQGAFEAFGFDVDNLTCSLLESGMEASQQVTLATGWLYYSSLPMGEKQYFGHRARFKISKGP